jgi:adenine-specific DNA-methyltransferase
MTQHFNTIIHADCTQFLPQLPSGIASFVLTDPPYLVSYRPRDGRTISNDNNDAWLLPAFAEMYRVLVADAFCLTFYGWPHADRFMRAFRSAGFRPVGHFAFPKPYVSSVGHVRCQHESAYLLAKGNPRSPAPLSDVIPWSENTGNKLHPTQKPLSVLLPLVETFSRAQGTVLDPFAGSGSSLMAAKMLGRSYIGIELDAQYHSLATRRLMASARVQNT